MTVRRTGTIGDRGDGPAPDVVIVLDDYGVLRRGDRWVALTPTQEVIVRVLLDRLGDVVGRSQLLAATWPSGGTDPHAIDVHIHKLRRRVRDLGLVIHTLRGRGFMLETAGGEPAARRR